MSTWLNFVSHPKAAYWQVSLSQTTYPANVDKSWSLLRRINTTLEMVAAVREQKDDSGGAAATAAKDLERIAAQDTDSSHNGDSHRGDTNSHGTLGTRDYIISRLLWILYHFPSGRATHECPKPGNT